MAQKAQSGKDTFSVFFPLDVRQLSAASKKTLDSLLYRDVLTPDKDLYVIGYADYVGRSSYNDTLSLHRASAVKEYLLFLGFKEPRIRLVTGRGEVEGRNSNSPTGWPTDRRVDIAIARKGFEDVPKGTKQDSLQPAVSPVSGVAGLPQVVKSAPAFPVDSLAVIPLNTAITLRNLHFPHGRHFVYRYSFPWLNALLNMLEENPLMRIRVEGHVCCIDPRVVQDALDEDTGEIALSVNRAKFIVEYLVKNGIERGRLEYRGFGKSRPVAHPERSAEDTEANRRVEIRVLSR